jgi:PST family polysaccharide transporter
MTEVGTKLLRGSIILASSRFVVNGIGFASTICLARLLSPEDFGLVALAAGFLALIGVLTNLPLSTALVQSDAVTDDHINTVWTLGVCRALVVALLFASAAYPIGRAYGDMRLTTIIISLAVINIISGFYNPKVYMLTRALIFKQDAIISISSKLLGFIAGVAAAFITQNYLALVIGNAMFQLCSTIASYFIAPHRPRLHFGKWREMIGFSIWLTLGDAVNTLNWRSDQIFLAGVLNPQALGYYSVGGDLAGLPTREAIAPLTQTLFPGFVAVKSDPNRLQNAVRLSQCTILIIALPIGIAFSILSQPIILLVLGQKWQSVLPVVQGLSLLYAIQSIATPAEPLAMALGQTRALFIRNLLLFLVRFPIVIPALLYFGLIGAVIGRMAAGLIHSIINLFFIKRLAGVGVRNQLNAGRRTFASVATMASVLYSLNMVFSYNNGAVLIAVTLLTKLAISAIVYVTACYVFWVIDGRPAGPETRIADMLVKLRVALSASSNGARKASF